MPFNTDDYTKAPWVNGIMTLTNDECIKVKDKCQEIKDNYVYNPYYPEASAQYVVSNYNESNQYKEAINGDTFHVIESYNPEVNTQGIDTNGIIPEPEEPAEEEGPTEGEETPVDDPEQDGEDMEDLEEVATNAALLANEELNNQDEEEDEEA